MKASLRFFETVWTESHLPKEQAAYDRGMSAGSGSRTPSFTKNPIVRFDFDDSNEFDENAYGKGGWVLYMLRHQLGDDAFWRSLKHYLEVNRGKNVVTADLIKAIEEDNHVSVDQFLPSMDLRRRRSEIRSCLHLRQTPSIRSL